MIGFLIGILAMSAPMTLVTIALCAWRNSCNSAWKQLADRKSESLLKIEDDAKYRAMVGDEITRLNHELEKALAAREQAGRKYMDLVLAVCHLQKNLENSFKPK